MSRKSGAIHEIVEVAPVPLELTRLKSIATRIANHEGRSFVEVSTASTSLQRQFYHFAIAVAERVLANKCQALEAIALELDCFSDLFEEIPLLGIERQLGLLGELLFLERLFERSGIAALDAWTGPIGEPHDFRFASREFEVKTTVSPRRVHTIHGMEQLIASNECALYLISVLLGPPGAARGFSLEEKVTELLGKFGRESGRGRQFEAALEACGFRDSDGRHYTRRYILRRPLGVASVDGDFPSITFREVQGALGPRAALVESLQYDVNVDTLVHDEGSAAFEAVFRDYPSEN